MLMLIGQGDLFDAGVLKVAGDPEDVDDVVMIQPWCGARSGRNERRYSYWKTKRPYYWPKENPPWGAATDGRQKDT